MASILKKLVFDFRYNVFPFFLILFLYPLLLFIQFNRWAIITTFKILKKLKFFFLKGNFIFSKNEISM